MWGGECNGCGMCCQGQYAGKLFRCEYLLIHDKAGRPWATSCGVYERRYKGMLVSMRSADGDRITGRCVPDYPREKDAAPPECSMVWLGDIDKKPAWSITYRPS